MNDEVSIKLPGGELLTGVITDGSVHRLELKKGEPVCAAFKASSVILAVDSMPLIAARSAGGEAAS